MAISPKSKGLGNIGGIVNRQGMASPTRPVAKPVMAKPTAPARPNTTTLAQRKAAPSPFRSATKPMAKVNPMTMQPQQPMTPQPIVDMPYPAPQPFNPNPNPGQGDFGYQPVDYGYGPGIVDPGYGQLPDFLKNLRPVAGGPSDMYEGPGAGFSLGIDDGSGSGMRLFDYNSQQPGMFNPGFGQSVDSTGMPTFEPTPGPISDPMSQFYGQQAAQTGMQGLGQMFGGGPFLSQPGRGAMEAGQQGLASAFNPTSNTNPSNSGSLFGGGGFANNG